MKYAEDILIANGKNEFFVHFFDDAYKQQHLDWFQQYLIVVEPVATNGDQDLNGTFYHVNFTGRGDHRLALYSAAWEDTTGSSLHPGSYQMFEWDYQGWISDEDLQKLEQERNPS
jgi:hypothetical protein